MWEGEGIVEMETAKIEVFMSSFTDQTGPSVSD